MSSPVNNAVSIDISKLKVNELKAELMVRGLDSKGLKSALVERLRAALEAEGKGTSVSTSEMSANQAATAAEVAANESTDLLSMSDDNICGSDDNNATLATSVTATVNDFSEIDKEIIGNDESQYMSAEDDVSIVKKELKPDVSELQTPMDVEVKGTILNEIKHELSEIDDKKIKDEKSPVKPKEEPQQQQQQQQQQNNQPRNASQNNARRNNFGKKRYDPEFEPDLNENATVLSWSDSDIHLDINRESFLEAKPFTGQVNGFLWSSARGTHGIRTGKVYYQVTITERMHWRDIWAYRANDKSAAGSGKHGRDDDAQQQQTTTKKSKMDEGVATSEVTDETNGDEQKSDAQIAIEKQVAEEGIDYSQDADINQLEKEQKEAAAESQQQQMQIDNENEKGNGGEESGHAGESSNESEVVAKQEEVAEPVIELTPEEKEAKRVAGTTHALRVGFSVFGTNLVVGDDHLSFAYDTVGYKATDSEYTVCRVPGLKETPEVGDTLTVFLDCGDETSDSIRMYVTYNTDEINGDENLVFDVKKSELIASAARKFAAEKERFEAERVRQNEMFGKQVQLEEEEREKRKKQKIQVDETAAEQKMDAVEAVTTAEEKAEGKSAESVEAGTEDNTMAVESTTNETQESTNDVTMAEPAETAAAAAADEEQDVDQYLKKEMDVEDEWAFVQPDLILFPHISSRNFAFKVTFGGPKAKKDVPVEAPQTTAAVEADSNEAAVAEPAVTNGDSEMSTTVTQSDVEIVKIEPIVKESEVEEVGRVIDGYEMIGDAKSKKSNGLEKMASRADCEVVLLIGMPGCGKTTWAQRYMRSEVNKHRPFYVLGKDQLVMRTKINGLAKTYINDYQLDRCVNSLVAVACQRRRNYIVDDSNLFFRTQLRRTEDFRAFQRRAVFIVLPDVLQTDIFTRRVFTQSTIYEMKANLVVPQGREYVQKFEFYTRGLMSEEAAHRLLKKYIKEGREAGYIFQRSQQQHNQHQRFGGNNPHQNYHRNQQHQHGVANRHYGGGHQQGHYDMYGNRNVRYQNWGGYNVDPWMYPPVGYYNQYSSYGGGNYNQMQGSTGGYNQRNWNNGGQWSNAGQWGTGYQGNWNAVPVAGYGYGIMGPGNMKQQKYGGNRRGRNQNWGGVNAGKGGKKNQNTSRNGGGGGGVQKTNGANSNGSSSNGSAAVDSAPAATEQQSAMQTEMSFNVATAE